MDVLLYGIGDTAAAETTEAQKVDKETQQQTAEVSTAAPKMQTTSSANTSSSSPTSKLQIPWYVYALGAGILLFGGILLSGKKDNKRK